ncbi:HAD family hydrolase [Alkalimarinus coralli]|uniref:HAD family hydrolase n=1 Tax=Alkalimarinus coralli TaxID=2935863 RepID=UPI00202AF15B|nr:hypothetical protein [Alkalimarinus coralli]
MNNSDINSIAKRSPCLIDLERKIENVEVVSFDFFDTLFIRPLCNPEDAFDILGNVLGIDNFRVLRKKAQVDAFAEMQCAGLKEITLKGIYSCFPACAYSQEDLALAEYQLEQALVHPNPEMIHLYRHAITKGKTVVITSDMYLSGDFFVESLAKHNIENVPLYISSDLNATKRDSGELFKVLAKDLDVAPANILHIGDNELADVKQAASKGLRTFFYRRERVPQKLDRYAVSASLARGLINLYADKIPEKSCLEAGFYYGGPASVGFLKWIEQQSTRDQIDYVLFLSRDGYLLSKLTECHQCNLTAKSDYFLGSRTAFMLAAINEHNFVSFMPYFLSGAEGLSPFELLERIGVPAPDSEVMRTLGLADSQLIDLQDTASLQQFLYAYRWQILKVCRRNRQGLLGSLTQLGIKSGHNLALVDVGWSGSTQEAFELAVDSMMDVNVHGYYFCLADTAEKRQRESKQKMSALFSTKTEPRDVIDNIYRNRVAIETFFSAPHDTVIGLEWHNGRTVALEDAGRGNTEGTSDKISDITRGGEIFANAYFELISNINMNDDAKDLAWPVIDFCTRQDLHNWTVFSEINNFDTWASTGNKNTAPLDYTQSP